MTDLLSTQDTPRTDHFAKRCRDEAPVTGDGRCLEFARQLERELAHMKRSNDLMMQRLAPSVEYVEGTPVGWGEDEIDRLEQKVTELTRDAARYRWLRNHPKGGEKEWWPSVWLSRDPLTTQPLQAAYLDDEIDNAIRRERL